MKKVICDHAWECQHSKYCVHRAPHDEGHFATCDRGFCDHVDGEVECVEAPDE